MGEGGRKLEIETLGEDSRRGRVDRNSSHTPGDPKGVGGYSIDKMSIYQGVAKKSRWVPKFRRTVVGEIWS